MAYRLLLVEDQADLRELILASLGYRGLDLTMEEACSIKEGRAHLTSSRFDLVILDLALPDGGGFSLLDQIRAGAAGPTPSDAPVLIYSALDPAKVGPLAEQKGASAHFRKSEEGLRSLFDWVEMTVFELKAAAHRV